MRGLFAGSDEAQRLTRRLLARAEKAEADMDDKAKAAYWRELADVNERHGRPSLAAVQRRSADRLDPPKPDALEAKDNQ